MKSTVCGMCQDGVVAVLQDSMKRIRILQHLSPQYFCDNGAVINQTTPVAETPVPKPKKRSVEFVKPRFIERCSTMSSSIIENAPYGECGRFERRMCKILDNIEIARAEITGVQAIKLPSGQIQFVNDLQIRQRKVKEDLQVISSCIEQTLIEMEEKGNFEVLEKYVNDQKEALEKMKSLSKSDKESEKIIHSIKEEIANSKIDFDEKETEFLKLIRHLKHQKQELVQKNVMESKFMLAKTKSDVQQLKLQLDSMAEEVKDEIIQINNSIEREELVNTEISMYLRNNIQNMEQNIEYWTNKHVVENQKFQLRLRTLMKESQQLTHELESLVSKYVRYEKVCIEDRQMKAEKAKLDAIEAAHNDKAFMIQKWWRFICVMLSIGPNAIKKKGKRGKKGKDKKKK